ncbi:MAG TPA: hypothetical protein VF488_06640 [Gemmatimonadaceae bacterium]
MLQLLQGRSVIRALGLGISFAFAVACLAAIACGAGSVRVSAPPAAASASAVPELASEDPHVQIEQLDHDISTKLARAQIPPPVATCSGATCTTAIGEPFSTPAVDPSCRTARHERCSDLCILATSICRDQERICTLAQHLPDDEWAANKCTRARASCQAAHDTCCGCVQQRRHPPIPI